MKKHNLLSIGEVSKISGVHINSLRYYDKLGILKPAYIDTDTKYRYYSNSQIGIIEAIQTCVELDIPLKQYLYFTDNEGQTIHAEQLLDYGKSQAEKKMQTIRKGLEQIKRLQSEIEHAKLLLNATQMITFEVPKKRYFVIQMKGTPTDYDYVSLDRLRFVAAAQGYQPGWELGLLYFYKPESVERYQFIEVLSGAKSKDGNVITILAGNFIAKVATADSIENAQYQFPKQFEQPYTKVVIETELFTGNIDMNNLLYELRCSIPD
jgi:DNA-binding transcriptional MerR regulator